MCDARQRTEKRCNTLQKMACVLSMCVLLEVLRMYGEDGVCATRCSTLQHTVLDVCLYTRVDALGFSLIDPIARLRYHPCQLTRSFFLTNVFF